MEGRSWIHTAFLLILQYAACDDTCVPNPGRVEPTALRLKSKLLCGYDHRVNPASSTNGVTIIQADLILSYMNYNLGFNSLDIEGTLRLAWDDKSLTWDPKDFDGKRRYSIDFSQIWVPEIEVQSAVSSRGTLLRGDSCRVHYVGHVICHPKAEISAHCTSDLRHWPYDRHNCSIELGTWMRTANIKYTTYVMDLITDYWTEREEEWHVEKITSKEVHEVSGSLGLNYSGIRIDYIIRRNAGSLVTTLVVPVFALAALTYAALLLPPDLEERLVLLSISLFCYCVLLKYIIWMMVPNGADAPLIVLLYRNCTIVTGVAIALTVLARMLMSSERVAPAWLTEIIVVLRSTPGVFILVPPETPKRMLELETIMSCNVPQTETEVQGVAEETAVKNGDARPPPGGGSEWRDVAVMLDRLTSIVVAVVFTALLFLGPTM